MRVIGGMAILLLAGGANAANVSAPAQTAPAAAPVTPAQSKPAGFAGLNHNSSEPIHVNADAFYADLNADTGTYRGNVVVVQGDMKLHADVVRVVAPDGKARQMEAHGHVVVDSTSGTATGDNGVYDVVSRVIHLTGQEVVLTKDRNVMRGNALDVDMASGQAHLVGNGRVAAVFVPPPQSSTPKPNHGPKPANGQAPATQPAPTPAPVTPTP